MKTRLSPSPSNRQWILGSVLGIVLCAASQLQAQPGPGGFGGFGGFGGGAQNRARSTSTRTYPSSGTVGDAVISIDPETHSLVVIADDETSQYISNVVANLDRPQPQVLIKVVFLEVTRNNSLDLGIEGAWGKSIGNSTTGALAHAFGLSTISSAAGSNAPSLNSFGLPISSFQAISPISGPQGAGLYQLASDNYQVTLRAIAQSGNAKVLSRPSIVARNNQPATITVGQSVPLVTGTRVDNFGNVINSFTYTPIGIILTVTPFITPDGMVQMILSPQTSELVADRTQWVPVQSGSSGVVTAPLINSRTADTVVVTPDGETVIIGGLMSDSKAESESKIPFLGDIPWLGNLFKRKTKQNSNTELLIFLTPHIIPFPSQLAQLTSSENRKAGTTKAFTDEELNKYLDKVPPSDPKSKTGKDAKPRHDDDNFAPPR